MRQNTLFRKLLTIVLVLAGAEVCYLFILSPFLPFKSVDISGIKSLDINDFKKQVGISSQTSFANLDEAKLQAAIAALPNIESAVVAKRYPSTLSIVLSERVPAARALVSVNGSQENVCIDREGVIISIGDQGMKVEGQNDLPIISGLGIENIYLGLHLGADYKAFFTRLAALETSSPLLLKAISEIHINPNNYSGFDLTLYPVSYKVKVRMNADLNEDELKYMLLMLDVFKEHSVNVDEIDLRGGIGAYTLSTGME
jgi:cell division septal protein FtsQ